MTSDLENRIMRAGASIVLNELRDEEKALRAAFPDLFGEKPKRRRRKQHVRQPAKRAQQWRSPRRGEIINFVRASADMNAQSPSVEAKRLTLLFKESGVRVPRQAVESAFYAARHESRAAN